MVLLCVPSWYFLCFIIILLNLSDFSYNGVAKKYGYIDWARLICNYMVALGKAHWLSGRCRGHHSNIAQVGEQSGLTMASEQRIDAIFNFFPCSWNITLLSLLLFPNRVLALDLVSPYTSSRSDLEYSISGLSTLRATATNYKSPIFPIHQGFVGAKVIMPSL